METTSKCIDNTRFEEDRSPLVDLSDSFKKSFVGRKQVLVVRLARNKGICWIGVEIRSDWLVQELITYQVGLHGEIGRHHLPEFAEVVQETTFIAEQIPLQLHEVISGVEGSKFNFETVLSQGQALVIISQLDRQRGRERFPLSHP